MYMPSTLSNAHYYLPALAWVNSVNTYLRCSFKTKTKPANSAKRSSNNAGAWRN